MGQNIIINVLYVDDEQNNLISFKATFRKHFNVFTALSAKEAELVLAKDNIHVLITDQRMPDTLGTELLADAVTKYPKQARILLTGYSDIEAIKDALNRGQILKYLTKPWNEEELKKAIEDGYDNFAENRKLEQLILDYKNKLDNFDSDFKKDEE